MHTRCWDQRVQSRAGYLEDDMVRRWSNLSLTQEVLGELYEGLVQDGSVTPGELASDPCPVQRVSGTGSAGTRLSDAYKQRDGGFCRTEHADVPAGTEREPAIARALPARQRPLRPHQRRQRRSAAGARAAGTGARPRHRHGQQLEADVRAGGGHRAGQCLPDKTLQRGGWRTRPLAGKMRAIGLRRTR